MDIRTLKVHEINPAKYNPRKDLQPGDPEYDKLKKSILEFDMVEPLVWNKRTKNLVGGHQRLKILRELGIENVEVSVVDLSEVKEKALNLALNKISGEWDFPMLKDLLQELDTGDFDMEITGFDLQEIEDLMTQFHVPEEGLTDDDAVPDATEAICKRGDLWQLGNHLLFCGDATVKTDVERLMGGEKADMVFTDPPYGFNLIKKSGVLSERWEQYQGEEDAQVFIDAFNLVSQMNVPMVFWGGIFHADVLPKCTYWIAWNKRGDNMTPDKRCDQTDIEVAWTSFKGVKIKQYQHIWAGYFRSGNRKEEGGYLHPTQKPVHLIDMILQEHNVGQVILDLFGGSGSTLIACEKLGRRCYMMEIDEHYCDVIIKRWEDFTGKQAVHIDGS